MSKFDLYKGIIIRISNSKDADQVLTILDSNGSRKALIAKGSKKNASKKAHAIELGNLIECKVVLGYSIPIVTEIKLNSEFEEWKKDYASIIQLQLLCEVLLNIVIDDVEDRGIFLLLEKILSSPGKSKILACTTFILKLLSISGFLPDISYCVTRQTKIERGKVFISESKIGFLCFQDEANTQKVDDLIYKIIKYIQTDSLENILKLSIEEKELKTILLLSMNWVEVASERELKSKRLL